MFRVAEASDIDRLIALADSCPGAPKWTPRTWRQVLESPVVAAQRIVLIADVLNECVGFGVLGLSAGDAEIESLAVSTAWRRRGIARRLCADLMGWARARGATQASLEVRVSNATARSLYESLGFHKLAIRRGYYRDPEEDALVMTIAI